MIKCQYIGLKPNNRKIDHDKWQHEYDFFSEESGKQLTNLQTPLSYWKLL
jgi:hypothetical protein